MAYLAAFLITSAIIAMAVSGLLRRSFQNAPCVLHPWQTCPDLYYRVLHNGVPVFESGRTITRVREPSTLWKVDPEIEGAVIQFASRQLLDKPDFLPFACRAPEGRRRTIIPDDFVNPSLPDVLAQMVVFPDVEAFTV